MGEVGAQVVPKESNERLAQAICPDCEYITPGTKWTSRAQEWADRHNRRKHPALSGGGDGE